MSKKVGIIALYYKTYNYGAQLQVYALQKTITMLGYEAEVVCFKWYITQLERFYRNASRNNFEKFESFSKSIPHSKRIFNPDDIRECADDYDVFVCGSDQLWGVNYSMLSYVLPQITLSFVPQNKTKIAYGVSMGGATAPENVKTIVSNPVRNLDALSVREKSAVSFVSAMTDKNVTSVLDPTMLLDAAEWDKITVLPQPDEEYIFMYNIGNNQQLDLSAKELSERLNCELKSISYSPEDSPGPTEFIGLIKNAKYILTNSFHGTVFSIIYQKEFWSFPSDNLQDETSKNFRFTDLLDTLGLSERFVGIGETLSFDSENKIDYSIVASKLQQKRDESIAFLKRSLEIEKTSEITQIKNPFEDIPDPLRDYIVSISDGKSEKELLYERRLIEKDIEIERLHREMDIEITRGDIYCKLLKFQSFGLSLDFDPLLGGKVILYGAGKIGRLASMCFNKNLLCFVDGYSTDKAFQKYPIYRLDDEDLKLLVKRHEKVIFLITPVWDFDMLETKIRDLYPTCGVVSIEKAVGKIWLV